MSISRGTGCRKVLEQDEGQFGDACCSLEQRVSRMLQTDIASLNVESGTPIQHRWGEAT